MKFPIIRQTSNNDCGPTCLKMIAVFYGQHYDTELLKNKCRIKKAGVSMLNIHKTAKALGFYSKGVKIGIEKLKEKVREYPVILHCHENHFAIVYKAPKPKKAGKFYIADPARGLIHFNSKDFVTYWNEKVSTGRSKNSKRTISSLEVGYALLLRPKH